VRTAGMGNRVAHRTNPFYRHYCHCHSSLTAARAFDHAVPNAASRFRMGRGCILAAGSSTTSSTTAATARSRNAGIPGPGSLRAFQPP
jgi:hypothetical protein